MLYAEYINSVLKEIIASREGLVIYGQNVTAGSRIGGLTRGFEELMKGKTTIVIAHRLSTISKMNRIVVLENGNIVEMGTHQELITKGGVYADLWNHQSGGFLED